MIRGPRGWPSCWWSGSGRTVAGTVTREPVGDVRHSTRRSDRCGPHEFGRVEAAERAAELLLEHGLFKSGDRVIKKEFTDLRYPPYWHYDILQALLILSRMDLVTDPRATDALEEIERKRRPDGRWTANGYWWRATGEVSTELVDWWRGEPNEMITLNALRVLKASGRLSLGFEGR